MRRARPRSLLVLASVTLAACMPVLRLAPGLEARPRRELRVRAGSDGDFDFGAFRVRHVWRGLVTSVSAGATSSLGGGVTGGVSLFASWQPIGFSLEGEGSSRGWIFRCDRYRDEDRRFAGLACDVGPERSPSYRVEIDPNGGRVLGIGNETALQVTTQRALSGSMIGAHVVAPEGPVAAVRLQPDMALVVATDAAPAARLGSAVLAAALFAGDDLPP